MTVEEKIAKAEEHLRELWETLIRERRRDLARMIEGVLAELLDDGLNPAERLKGTTSTSLRRGAIEGEI